MVSVEKYERFSMCIFSWMCAKNANMVCSRFQLEWKNYNYPKGKKTNVVPLGVLINVVMVGEWKTRNMVIFLSATSWILDKINDWENRAYFQNILRVWIQCVQFRRFLSRSNQNNTFFYPGRNCLRRLIFPRGPE